MIRKVFSLLPIVLMAFGIAKAQTQLPCSTTEMNDEYKRLYPKVQQSEDQLRAFIAEGMKNFNYGNALSKGTAFGPDDVLHIPVVVHVIHDYGAEYVDDQDIYDMIDQINEVYSAKNTDLSNVIAPFKPYIGNPKMQFHLATRDPKGKPSTGITRRQSYLTVGGDDQAKLDQWDPTSYLNIWTINKIGRQPTSGQILAYAVFPSSAAQTPYTDGIIAGYQFINKDKTVPHEIGHIFNLYHTWGNVPVATNCNGDDEVDDTPPTTGHFGGGSPFGNTANGNCDNASLYDTSCTNNIVSMSKILLDSTLSPGTDNNPKSLEYVPSTTLYLESVSIYPTKIGDEFEIIHTKTTSGGAVVGLDTLTTTHETLALPALGSAVATSSLDTPDYRSGMQISVNTGQYIWIDSFAIYPTTVGDSFRIELSRFNGTLIKSYAGKTTTNSGPQMIPFQAFVPYGNYHRLLVTKNPGLKSDSVNNTLKNTFESMYQKRGKDNIVNIVYPFDTTGDTKGTAANDYRGRYMYFYDMHIRYGALTTTDSGAQQITLGSWDAVPDGSTYKLSLTKNPNLINDLKGPAPYVTSIPCIIDVKNEVTDGRYNTMYNLNIRYGYIKNCIDYPDTVNTQNIMDYANCPTMFTDLQVKRMRLALSSPIGGRNNLVNETTHIRTGILNTATGTYYTNTTMPTLVPVPEVSVEKGSAAGERTFFLCSDRQFKFKQRSWRSKVNSVDWTFSNAASIATLNQSGSTLSGTVTNSFGEPGWVDVTLKANGTAGDSTIVYDNMVYAADPVNSINPVNGFYMDFEQGDANNPIDKWPTFNYYKNRHYWHVVDNVGFTGTGCMRFNNFDNRNGAEIYTGSPNGDYDDFFTPAFDLSGMNGICRLNFMSSGAFRTTDSRIMKDTLEISYSTDCGETWTTMAKLSKAQLANKGTVGIEYSPLYSGDWKLQSFDVPVKGSPKVFFRFRYHVGGDNVNNTVGASIMIPGTGNHFYIDRVNISSFPLGVNTLLADKNVALAPNPTNGSSQLIIKSTSNELAQVMVTDITGKVVYTTNQQMNGSITTIDIPASAIKAKGIYMVHVQAGTESFTEKLVSY